MTDDIMERERKIGDTTIRSIDNIAGVKHIEDSDADFVTPEEMLAELKEDNLALTRRIRQIRNVCDEHGDVATANSIESSIDEADVAHMLPVLDDPGDLIPERMLTCESRVIAYAPAKISSLALTLDSLACIGIFYWRLQNASPSIRDRLARSASRGSRAATSSSSTTSVQTRRIWFRI
jgi:starvation-inducible DNA-binding protein